LLQALNVAAQRNSALPTCSGLVTNYGVWPSALPDSDRLHHPAELNAEYRVGSSTPPRGTPSVKASSKRSPSTKLPVPAGWWATA